MDLKDLHKTHVFCWTILPLKYLYVVKAGLPSKGAAFFSDLFQYLRTDFLSLFLMSHAYLLLPGVLEGFPLKVMCFLNLFTVGPFLRCWLRSVTALTVPCCHSGSEGRGGLASTSHMCLFHTRASNHFLVSDLNR